MSVSTSKLLELACSIMNRSGTHCRHALSGRVYDRLVTFTDDIARDEIFSPSTDRTRWAEHRYLTISTVAAWNERSREDLLTNGFLAKIFDRKMSSRSWVRPRALLGASMLDVRNLIVSAWSTLLCAALSVVSSASPTSAEKADFSHILQIEFSVEFDGERVDFDELVFCGVREKGTLTTQPTTQVLPTRQYVSKELSDGSMLGFYVSWRLCSLHQSVWRPGADESTDFRAPAQYLPPIQWFNSTSVEARTYGEEYLSASYFSAPYSRIQIIEPMRFSVPIHPPTPLLIEEAFKQEDREKLRRFGDSLKSDGNLIPILVEEWSNTELYYNRFIELGTKSDPPELDRFATYLDSLSIEQGLVPIDTTANPWMVGPLVELLREKLLSATRLYEFGIPQSDIERDGLLVTADISNEIYRRADDLIPLTCSENSIAQFDPVRRGMRYYRPEFCTRYGFAKFLEINGLRVPWDGSGSWAIYDTRTRTIYVRDK